MIRTPRGHGRLLPVPGCLITATLSPGPACVSAGGSAVLRGPGLQLQPPRAGCSPAEAAVLRERPKEGPPEADPHDDRRSLWPQWTHCERGERVGGGFQLCGSIVFSNNCLKSA